MKKKPETNIVTDMQKYTDRKKAPQAFLEKISSDLRAGSSGAIIENAEKQAAEDTKGAINIYTCPECGHHIVTKDIDRGTTPFLYPCEDFACKGMMKSSMYRVFDQAIKPGYHWIAPPKETWTSYPVAVMQHLERGGLLLRKADGTMTNSDLKMLNLSRTQGIDGEALDKAVAVFLELFPDVDDPSGVREGVFASIGAYIAAVSPNPVGDPFAGRFVPRVDPSAVKEEAIYIAEAPDRVHATVMVSGGKFLSIPDLIPLTWEPKALYAFERPKRTQSEG